MLAIGILFGLLTTRITDVMMWIVGALYGGYVMANVLKWYWWRFNGYGYFWGMVAGIVSAMFARRRRENDSRPPRQQPALSVSRSSLRHLRCRLPARHAAEPAGGRRHPENFYKNVNPWGFWGPIRDKVVREDPAFKPNRRFRPRHDQCRGRHRLAIVPDRAADLSRAAPMDRGCGAIVAGWSSHRSFIKFNWYDKLEKT